jgi:hypothetical protein
MLMGFAVILAAVTGYWASKSWVESRTLRAVDIPVSLAKGTIQTGTFKLNVHGFYSITIGMTQGGDLTCSGVGLETRRLSSIGTLPIYRYKELDDEGRSTGRNTIPGRFLGGFEGVPGRYDLQFEVVSDTGCLDASNPRLYIIASNDDFYRWYERYTNLCWVSFLVGVFGLTLIIASVIERLRTRSEIGSDLSIFR